ncbi:MAG: glucose-6-phosphate isomerase, partial [Thermoplasmata archaeon]|nr:glucose-6-phosphate isomerase [Thermoplasmata archaeon]
MIRINYDNMMASYIGRKRGITDAILGAVAPKARAAFAAVEKLRGGDEVTFFHLPYQRKEVGEIISTADGIASEFDEFIVLGIGGSALGSIALQKALSGPFCRLIDRKARGGRPRVFVLDNIDPDTLDAIEGIVDLRRTLFNVITKSGGTAETMSTFLIFRDKLLKRFGKKGLRRRIITTTDEKEGILRRLT